MSNDMIPKLVDKVIVEVGGKKYISMEFVAIEIKGWASKIGIGEDKYRTLVVRILNTILIKFERLASKHDKF